MFIQSSHILLLYVGLPVVLSVLKEERDDVEMVRGALETLVSAMTPIDTSLVTKNEVQPASMNSDLLSREADNISLILSLLVSIRSLLFLSDRILRFPSHPIETKENEDFKLCKCFHFVQSEDDFYIRYYTLQLLTALLTHSPNRYLILQTYCHSYLIALS